jgi:hypothetical protein
MGYTWFRQTSLSSLSKWYVGGHNALLIRAIHFFVVVLVVVRGYNPLRVPLSPLLAALGILLGALDGDVGWWHSAATGGCLPVT